MCVNPHRDLSEAILLWLKGALEAATMTFNEFHEAIGKVHPCDRAALAVTVTLLELNGEVAVTKDELGRGRGFALPTQCSN